MWYTTIDFVLFGNVYLFHLYMYTFCMFQTISEWVHIRMKCKPFLYFNWNFLLDFTVFGVNNVFWDLEFSNIRVI